MKEIKNSIGMTLEAHSEESTLYHLTFNETVEYIKTKGILPSQYGDIEIEGNDGRGVYCVENLDDLDYIMSLAGWLIGIENTSVIEFKTAGNWYKCINEIVEDTGDEDCEDEFDCADSLPHYGYVVHPDAIPKENIVSTKPLIDILHNNNIVYP